VDGGPVTRSSLRTMAARPNCADGRQLAAASSAAWRGSVSAYIRTIRTTARTAIPGATASRRPFPGRPTSHRRNHGLRRARRGSPPRDPSGTRVVGENLSQSAVRRRFARVDRREPRGVRRHGRTVGGGSRVARRVSSAADTQPVERRSFRHCSARAEPRKRLRGNACARAAGRAARFVRRLGFRPHAQKVVVDA